MCPEISTIWGLKYHPKNTITPGHAAALIISMSAVSQSMLTPFLGSVATQFERHVNFAGLCSARQMTDPSFPQGRAASARTPGPSVDYRCAHAALLV